MKQTFLLKVIDIHSFTQFPNLINNEEIENKKGKNFKKKKP